MRRRIAPLLVAFASACTHGATRSPPPAPPAATPPRVAPKPRVLATARGARVLSLAADDTTAAWVSSDLAGGTRGVYVVENGKAPLVLRAPDDDYTVDGVAIGGGWVHWCEAATVRRANLDGSVKETFAQAAGGCTALSADGAHVRWTTAEGPRFKKPISGGPAILLGPARAHEHEVRDDEGVAWTYYEGPDGIMRHRSAGGTATLVLAKSRYEGHVAVSATTIFFVAQHIEYVNTSPGGCKSGPPEHCPQRAFTIERAPVTGGGSTRIAPTSEIDALYVDGTHVYWATSGVWDTESILQRATLAGNDVTTLLELPWVPRGIVFASKRVVFGDHATESIVELEK